MKKRLLITSIVMMLVVAVALSTATYAWFTSNAKVEASTVTMTAATSNLASISMGWLNNETKSGSIAGVAGSALLPMVPVALTGTTAATVDFNESSVGLDGNFDAAGSTTIPYTWTAPAQDYNSVTAFYINNDSTTQALNISVSVKSITNYDSTYADLTPLPAGTLLQSGQIYYKKLVDGETNAVTWVRLEKDTTANYATGKYVADSTTATGDSGDFVVYGTKGIEDYVRVAIFATSAYASTATKPTSVVAADYTYKGVLAKAANAEVAYGAIQANTAPSVLTTAVEQTHPAISTTASVPVISNLAALSRVYVIVKVWIDGTYFTTHESGQQANVSLEFNATNYTAG